MLWTEKYRPRELSNYYGTHPSLLESRKWINEWRKGFPSKRALMLSGPPGCGKTSLAYSLAGCSGRVLIETNASDSRSKNAIEERIGTTINTVKNALVLVDEVDGMSSGDSGGVIELARLISITSVPIICCCNDSSLQKLEPVMKVCAELRMPRIPKQTCLEILKNVFAEEKKKAEGNSLELLYDVTNGDVRNMLLHAQNMVDIHGSLKPVHVYSMGTTRMDSSKSISQCAEDIMQKKGTLDERMGFHYDYPYLKDIVAENYPKGKVGLNECSYAASTMAQADAMDADTPNIDWTLEFYSGAISTVCSLALLPPSTTNIYFPPKPKTHNVSSSILSKIKNKVGGDDFSAINEVYPIIQGRICTHLSVRTLDFVKLKEVATYYGFTAEEVFEIAKSVLQPKGGPIRKQVEEDLNFRQEKQRKSNKRQRKK